MSLNRFVDCTTFPCLDTRRESYITPEASIDPGKVRIFLSFIIAGFLL